MNEADELYTLAAQHCTERQRMIMHLKAQGWSHRRIGISFGLHHSTITKELDTCIAACSRALWSQPGHQIFLEDNA